MAPTSDARAVPPKSTTGRGSPLTPGRRFAGATGRFLVEVAKVVFVALIIILPVRMFVVQPFSVSGSSMVPSFNHRDYLVIDEISYRFKTPERGEVVVFRFPDDPSQFFIKRIIGLPGETIRVNEGNVFVVTNGIEHQIEESAYLPEGTVTTGPHQEVVLADNEFFVLGDNRAASSDSRVWGPIEKSDIIGKAWIRAWPATDAEVVDTPSYDGLAPLTVAP